MPITHESTLLKRHNYFHSFSQYCTYRGRNLTALDAKKASLEERIVTTYDFIVIS